MTPRRKIIAGNWKMNKTTPEAIALATELVAAVGKRVEVDVVICPPLTALESVCKLLDGSTIRAGAQNFHPEDSGAFTGEVSAPMLRALFASYVIVGHSERRQLFGETDELVNRKVLAALKNQLRPILCVGEVLAERESGATLKVIQQQVEKALAGVTKEGVANLVFAYEPVWAIGTGKVATADQAQEVHAYIRGLLGKLFGTTVASKVRVLYGGSMKPANAAELLAEKDIDGGLIGGASLEARTFIELVNAAAKPE